MSRSFKCLDKDSINICLIGPFASEGGVARSVLNTAVLFRFMGLRVKLLPLFKHHRHLLKLAYLHTCDVVHVHGPLLLEYIMLLFKASRSVRILTLHGWVLEEMITFLRYMYDIPLAKRIIVTFFILINWLVNKFVFIPFTVHIVTAVSKITAEKNKVSAITVVNPFLDYYIKERIKECSESNKSDNEIWITSYVSIGGGKILSIPRIIKVVVVLNKLLEAKGEKVVLHIFGKDIPKWLEELCMKYAPIVKLMHYRREYVCYLKSSDLFIAGYTMPELGHAVLEAISLGVPIAKYTDNPLDEEIIDGFNGILAQHDTDMVKKVYDYLLHMNKMRDLLAKNAKETILKKRSPTYISGVWRIIIEKMMSPYC